MIPTHHKDEMHVAINKANQEIRKPVIVCNYNVSMLEVDLKDRMSLPYLLERKKGAKYHLKLLKRLLNVAIQNIMVLYYWSLPINRNRGSLKFGLSLAQGLVQMHSSGVSCPVHGHPSNKLLPKRILE